MIAGAFFYVLTMHVTRTPGDDTDIRNLSLRLSAISYVKRAWLLFSGRLTAKLLEWLSGRCSVELWKILESICFVFLGCGLYAWLTLFDGQKSGIRPWALLSCLCLPYLIHIAFFNEVFLWIAGTTNYAFVMVPGLWGSYLMARQYIKKDLNFYQKIFCGILLLFSCAGSEQVCAVVMTFLGISLFTQINIKKKDCFIFLMELLIIVCFLFCYVFCPGTGGRFEYELVNTPDFYTVPLTSRIQYTIRWFLDAVINRLCFLLSFVFLVTGMLTFFRNKAFFSRLVGVTLGGYGTVALVAPLIGAFTNVMPGWGITVYTIRSTVLVVFWAFGLVLLLFGSMLAFNSRRQQVACTLMILASYASLLIMVISPSMYPSGNRTAFVSALILCVYLLMAFTQNRKLLAWKILPVASIGMVLLFSAYHYYLLIISFFAL